MRGCAFVVRADALRPRNIESFNLLAGGRLGHRTRGRPALPQPVAVAALVVDINNRPQAELISQQHAVFTAAAP